MTASELPDLYPDPVRTRGASENDFSEIVGRLADTKASAVDFQVIGGRAYSVSDQFELVALAAGELIEGRKPGFPAKVKGLLGPDSPPPASSQTSHLDWFAFRDATRDVIGFLKTNQRVPSQVFIGADAVPAADFLAGLASACNFHRKHGTLPLQEGVTIGKNLELLPARHVAKDTPGLFGGWIIHKEGFRAPKILEIARLQAWTLKPAMLKP